MAEMLSRIEKVEDFILRKVLLVTLVQQQHGGAGTIAHEYMYLELLAAELLSEGKNLALNRDVLERVLMARLLGGGEMPFVYLVGCYWRALDEHRKLQNMKDKQILAEVQYTLGQVRDLCVSHVGNVCLYPGCEAANDGHSDLLGHILADISPSVGTDPGTSGVGASRPTLPPGFLDDFINFFEAEKLGDIFNPVFRDLQRSVTKLSPLGPFQGPLRALVMLVSHPPLATALVNHPLWHPKGEHVNGRVLEVGSILGPFFYISTISDHPVFGNGEPNVGQRCFADISYRVPSDIISSFATIRTVMHQLYEGLHELLLKLLKSADNRESVLQYFADLIQKNVKSEVLQANPFTNASNGMFVCLSAVMLSLCKPFFDISSSKRDKIDAGYVLHKGRIDFSSLTGLHATSEEVAEWVDKSNLSRNEGFRQQKEQEEMRRMDSHEATTSSSSNGLNHLLVPVRSGPEQRNYSFICECFFLTARVLNLGLVKAISNFKSITQELSRQKKALNTLRWLRDVRAPPNLESMQGMALVERLSQDWYCYEAQLSKDTALLQNALSFYRLMIVWLVSLVGGFKMPLPIPCPMEFASMPEHFVEDSLELLLFASRVPRALDGMVLDEFMSFIVMFMESPLHVKNPYLRAKMVEVLSAWMPSKSDSAALRNSMASLLEGHQLALQYLVPNLLKLYVEIEFTGSKTQFYDKFNIRYNIGELLEYLWDVPSHRTCWKQIAVTEERGAYLKFLNLLINDSTSLLEESLNKMSELKEMEAEMENTAEWERPTPQERTRFFHQQENVVRIDMTLAKEDVKMLRYTSAEITAPFLLPEMVERIASMLNYFLMQLVGPQRRMLRLNNPEKYEFNPRELLSQIVDIYVHLERGDINGVFPKAISSDARSFREELFPHAATVLSNSELQSEQVLQEFLALGVKSEIAATQAILSEELHVELQALDLKRRIEDRQKASSHQAPTGKMERPSDGMFRKLTQSESDMWNGKHKKTDVADFVSHRHPLHLIMERQRWEEQSAKLRTGVSEGEELEELCKDLLNQLEQRNAEIKLKNVELQKASKQIREQREEIQKLKRDEVEECIICMNEFGQHLDQQRAYWKDCNHANICYKCTKTLWSSKHRQCPSCRTPASSMPTPLPPKIYF